MLSSERLLTSVALMFLSYLIYTISFGMQLNFTILTLASCPSDYCSRYSCFHLGKARKSTGYCFCVVNHVYDYGMGRR